MTSRFLFFFAFGFGLNLSQGLIVVRIGHFWRREEREINEKTSNSEWVSRRVRECEW
jgi:hypothetical protein